MQRADRFAKGCRVLLGTWITTARPALGWLLSAITVVWALGIGIPTPLLTVQAQDGGTGSGTRISAAFVLQVDTSDPKLNNLCLGESVLLPVTVRLRTIEFPGAERDLGSFTVRNADITPEVADPSIVSAVQGGFSSTPAADAPFQTHVNLTGEETGRTTITINATVRSDVIQSLDEEVALPIPITSQADPVTVSVRVLPCEYRVTINSIWETSMHGAFTILIANVHNARLRSGESFETLEFEPPLTGPPFLEWTWANNRIIGCLASGGHFNTHAPTIRARRVADKLEVTINYARSVPGDGNSQYYRNLCLPHFSGEPCSEHPDGMCWTMPVSRPVDWFEPQRLEPPKLVFLLNGGSISAPHLINHSWGSANGTAIITLTPVRLQP
jgi:hypothetical protein